MECWTLLVHGATQFTPLCSASILIRAPASSNLHVLVLADLFSLFYFRPWLVLVILSGGDCPWQD